jgi:hypothetical protein
MHVLYDYGSSIFEIMRVLEMTVQQGWFSIICKFLWAVSSRLRPPHATAEAMAHANERDFGLL